MEPMNQNPIQPQAPEPMIPDIKPSNRMPILVTILILVILGGVIAWVLIQRNNIDVVENTQDTVPTLNTANNSSSESEIKQSNSDSIDALEQDAQNIRNDDLSTTFESEVQTELKN